MNKLKSPFTILQSTFNIFKIENKEIFYPFILIIFIQFLALEILYFIPQYPLSLLFGPIVDRIWGEAYMHYPMNLILLPKIFYSAQMLIFIFISGFLFAVTNQLINAINNEERVSFKIAFRKSLPSYIYILIYSIFTLLLFNLFSNAYGMLIQRAAKIHSTSGIFFIIKKAVILGAPYAQFLYGILVTAMFIYVPVLIIIEKKKLLAAMIGNFKVLFGSFWLTFTIILIPMLFYIPLLLLRDNLSKLAEMTSPDVQVWIIAISILVISAINVFLTAAATTYYLYKRDSS